MGDQQKNLQNLATKKVMDLLAGRAHSETELREKLEQKLSQNEDLAFDDINEAIDYAIETAKKNKWLSSPAELSAQIAEGLHQRQKGIEYINAYLAEKGLPAVEANEDFELEKAAAIIKNKYRLNENEPQEFSEQELAKMGQMLVSRGFDPEVARKAIYEKL